MKRRRVGPIAERKLEQLGTEGVQWYAGLDDLVDDLAAAWRVTVGAELAGGTHAYVAEAVTADGELAVLKVALPELDNPGKHFEVPVMLAGQGRGYVKVFAHDEGRRALLLERLGTSLGDSGATVDEQLQVICETLSPWAPAPPGLDVPTGAGKAAWLREFAEAQWTELGRPCSESAIRQMQGFASAREHAHDPSTAVLVHGDAHEENLLLAVDGTYRLIDPEGLIGEPAIDLSVPMRGWNDDLVASGDPAAAAARRCRRISELTAVDTEGIWQWGYMERVSSALYCESLGLTSWSTPAYAVIEACVGVTEV